MSIIANLIDQEFVSKDTEIDGKTLTTPVLTYTDGVSVTYSVDVDIGREGEINENGDIGNLPLYGVPIAFAGHELIYADVGTPVRLSRATTGHWEVVGFAKTFPNTYEIYPVTLPSYCLTVPTENPPGLPELHPPIVGDPISIGQEIRLLTYGELSVYGTYGSIPYGARGIFVGGELSSIVV